MYRILPDLQKVQGPLGECLLHVLHIELTILLDRTEKFG